MGWTFTDTTKTAKEFMDDMNSSDSWTSNEFEYNNLASGMGKGCYYAAIERKPKFGVIGPKKVFCVVALVKYKKSGKYVYNEIGYKMMDESYGPYNYDVPSKVRQALLDNKDFAPNDENSIAWRAEVFTRAETKKPKLVLGCKIKLPEKLNYPNGLSEDTFILVQEGRAKVFKSSNHGFLCKIRRETLANTELQIVA